MREPGQAGGWKVLAGSFGLTGEAGGGETAFAVRGLGPGGWARTGREDWAAYRPMVSLKLERGEAGLWAQAADGGKLALTLGAGEGEGAKLTLALHYPDKTRTLASAGIPRGDGWRRLAFFAHGGKTLAYLDGAKVLEVADAPEVRGACGLCVLDGAALFDDFHAVDAAALEPGRDVAPGEESSAGCLERYRQRCFEKLSVYAPQWFLPPDPDDPARLRIPLPLFAGGELAVDGGAPVALSASPEPLVTAFPEGRAPAFDLQLRAPGWRDYHFAGRVTDWYASSGEWKQVNRWSCSPTYLWYGGESNRDAVLWHKREVDGPVAVEALMAPRADRRYGEEEGRDLNLVLHGNGEDLNDGYLVTVAGEGLGCRLLRDGKVLAESRLDGLPAGHALHHAWFSVGASVVDGKVRCYFDRRLALEYDDPRPLNKGQVGVWTVRNKLSLARATVATKD
ncbi:MAG: hypothetical protein M5U26_23560 [Planctomycetota bacterium]|nr:hypothetical protein [Planctomycetota bacterium]